MHLYSQLIQAETGDVIKQSVRCNQVVTTTGLVMTYPNGHPEHCECVPPCRPYDRVAVISANLRSVAP